MTYELADGSGTVEIATTRPETMLGDTAIAVHPEDERYQELIGKRLFLPLVNKEIPIIADTYVDQEFGTGVVKSPPPMIRMTLKSVTAITCHGSML